MFDLKVEGNRKDFYCVAVTINKLRYSVKEPLTDVQ